MQSQFRIIFANIEFSHIQNYIPQWNYIPLNFLKKSHASKTTLLTTFLRGWFETKTKNFQWSHFLHNSIHKLFAWTHIVSHRLHESWVGTRATAKALISICCLNNSCGIMGVKKKNPLFRSTYFKQPPKGWTKSAAERSWFLTKGQIELHRKLSYTAVFPQEGYVISSCTTISGVFNTIHFSKYVCISFTCGWMSPACRYNPYFFQLPEAKNLKEMEKPTAIVQPIQFLEIIIAEIHALPYYIHEVWYVRYNCWFSPVPECSLAIVHHRRIVIGNVQGVWCFIIVFIEIMFFTWMGKIKGKIVYYWRWPSFDVHTLSVRESPKWILVIICLYFLCKTILFLA